MTAPHLPASDAVLLDLEREALALRGIRGKTEAQCDRMFALEKAIARAPVVGLIGAAIKLRWLLSPDGAIVGGVLAPGDNEETAVRQVLAVVESVDMLAELERMRAPAQTAAA